MTVIMDGSVIYFCRFSFLGIVFSWLASFLTQQPFLGIPKSIFYIDSTLFSERVVIPFLRICGFEVSKLDFKLLDIKDENGELLRARIPRNDLFEIENEVVGSDAYKSLYHESWQKDRVKGYIKKGLFFAPLKSTDSIAQFVFIIEVVAWHMRSHEYAKSVLIMGNRPWFGVFRDYAAERGIDLYKMKFSGRFSFDKSYLRSILIKYPRLYGILRKFKYGQTWVKSSIRKSAVPKLYIEGRGDLSLINDGYNSDFFWHLNSEFPRKYILYNHCSKQEEEYFKSHGIQSVAEGSVDYEICYKKPKLCKDRRFIDEYRAIGDILSSYNFQKNFFGSFFKTHSVKVFLSWFKFSNSHMAVADAINENGGVLAVWQMAFDGYMNIESRISADIYFCFSKFSQKIDKQLGSDIKYNIVTGYPKDYVGPLLREEAIRVREKLKSNGAEKIVFAIDENSNDDERWHSGHGLQRENYSHILEKVLVTPWLGVIFKPKSPRNLRKRLGSVADLLAEAEKTGRCFVYEGMGKYTSSVPPVLAGLSADVCIHGHLGAGTAALECAFEGLPTLLIDSEGYLNSKLYELPEGKVVFKDWPETIDAVMEHFQTPGGVSGFGDWSSILDELDPFRDGKAAYRMGTYLHWLIQGFEKGMEREEIMYETAEKYKKQWGADKVLSTLK